MSLRRAALELAAGLPAGDPTRKRILDTVRTADAGFYVDLKDLPPWLRKILASQAAYRRRSIEVIPSTTVDVGTPAFEGNRAYVIAVNLGTQQYETVTGDWSGGFGTSAVDRGGTYRIPPNGAAIVGEYGGRGSFARLYINPDNVAALIEETEGPELTEDEKYAITYLAVYNSQGRKDAFWRKGFGEYGPKHPLIVSLVSKGLAKTRGRGVVITTPGQNVVKGLPRKYRNTW